MGELFGWISYVLERWNIFIVLSFSLFPLRIWDRNNHRYLGFSRLDTQLILLMMFPAGILFSRLADETVSETVVTLAVGYLMLILIPRIYAEFMYRRHYGVWIDDQDDYGDSESNDVYDSN
ncbi:MAG: hypothetical protein OXH27_09955 [Gammaproteobacteria bacterium]|nr:hypothetical protein [Gammaproteobacteria bacterium]MDE0508834.1 hypothetical protein [Gammaproteobacteria bacterium]